MAAPIFKSRVLQTSTDTGTGNLELIAPATGLRSLVDTVGDGGATYLTLVDSAGNVEINLCTVHAGTPDYISRSATPIWSTNSNNKVDFTGNTISIFIGAVLELIPMFAAVPSLSGNEVVQYVAGTGWQARSAQDFMASLPFEGMRNRIINGDMRINQRGSGTLSVNTAGTVFYAVDRWGAAGQSTDGVFSIEAVTVSGKSWLKATVTTPDASIGSSQIYGLFQRIEGYNVRDLQWGQSTAKAVTLSFKANCSVTGTYSGAIQNGATNRTYPFTFTVSQANVDTNVSVTIPGDTSGTWLTTTGIGMTVWFSFGVGSSFKGSANAWSGSALYGATGSVDLISTNGATFAITDVQLEAGSVATPFEHRDYQSELLRCRRYFQRYTAESTNHSFNTGQAYASTNSIHAFPFDTPMRTKGTFSYSGTFAVYNATGTPQNCSSLVGGSNGSTNHGDVSTVLTGLVAGNAAALLSTNAADYLQWDAEL